MFERVLIPTDLSAESDSIFDFALALDGLKEVVAVHAVEASSYELIKEHHDEPAGAAPIKDDDTHMEQELKRIEKRLLEKGRKLIDAGIRFRTLVDEGDMVDMKIVDLAQKENASLILMGSHGKSPWEEILYGCVSERVVRKARVPVLVLRYDLFKTASPDSFAVGMFKKVLFPVDLTPTSDKVVDLLQLIKPREVTVLHRLNAEESEAEEGLKRKKKLANIQKQLEAAGVKTDVALCYGDILDDILKASENATSVVMASAGKGLLREWLTGSISLNVLRRSKVPVLLAHQKDVY